MKTSNASSAQSTDLWRADCPAYNEALAAAFAADPSLTSDPGRAAALAAELYNRHGRLETGAPEELLRPLLLQRAIAGFEALPWVHGDPARDQQFTLGITAILDLAGFSARERRLVASLFAPFDYYEDGDLSQASFVAFTAKHSEAPSARYQAASLRLARDGAEARLIESDVGRKARLVPSRSLARRLADRALVAFG